MESLFNQVSFERNTHIRCLITCPRLWCTSWLCYCCVVCSVLLDNIVTGLYSSVIPSCVWIDNCGAVYGNRLFVHGWTLDEIATNPQVTFSKPIFLNERFVFWLICHCYFSWWSIDKKTALVGVMTWHCTGVRCQNTVLNLIYDEI